MPIGCQAAIDAAEGRREVAVTHLALARSQNRRKRHFGVLSREKVTERYKRFYKRVMRRSFKRELRKYEGYEVQKK